MDIRLLKSRGGYKAVNENPSGHSLDTGFESCWPINGGNLRKIHLKPGFDIYVMDCDCQGHLNINSSAWPTGFGFKFFVSGKMKYKNSAFKEEMIMSGGFNRLSFFPFSSGTGECISGERLSVITVSMTTSFFNSLFNNDTNQLKFLKNNGLNRPFYKIRPNTPAMEAAARSVLNCSFHGSLKRVFLESKAMELVTYQLDNIEINEKNNGISQEERDKIEYAREVLILNIDSPPSFLTLSRMVGMSHNRLSSGFMTLYGQTPFGLLREIRLEKSKILLESNKGNVTEIAMEVGYASISHFAKAFRGKYGISPKQYQMKFCS